MAYNTSYKMMIAISADETGRGGGINYLVPTVLLMFLYFLLVSLFVDCRCSDQAVLLKTTAWSSEHGMGAAWAWHGKCESDTVALSKSSGKDTF